MEEQERSAAAWRAATHNRPAPIADVRVIFDEGHRLVEAKMKLKVRIRRFGRSQQQSQKYAPLDSPHLSLSMVGRVRSCICMFTATVPCGAFTFISIAKRAPESVPLERLLLHFIGITID